jgi:dihydrofolate synthase/folylpolyglutamate synthase
MQRGAPLTHATRDLVRAAAFDRGRATIAIETPVRRYPPIQLALAGAHQVNNALVAVRMLELADSQGVGVPPDAIVAGLEQTTWPARLEWLRLPGGTSLLIDAAHNPAGAEALADYLRAAGVAPLPIVFAVMRDKNVAAMARALAPVASRFITTAVHSARALDPTTLAATVRRVAPDVLVEDIVGADAAVAHALEGTPRAVAAGSIFFVGPLRARLLASGAVSFAC